MISSPAPAPQPLHHHSHSREPLDARGEIEAGVVLLHRPRSLLLVPTKEQSMTVLVAPIRSTILARSAFTRRSDIRPLAVVLAMTPPAALRIVSNEALPYEGPQP